MQDKYKRQAASEQMKNEAENNVNIFNISHDYFCCSVLALVSKLITQINTSLYINPV
jgi:hypothetical protein